MSRISDEQLIDMADRHVIGGNYSKLILDLQDSREETRKAIDGELKNADLYLESQRSLHKAEAMIRAMRNALKIIVSNTLNPAKTMTKLGLEETQTCNRRLALNLLEISEEYAE